jgi:adenosine deaminase
MRDRIRKTIELGHAQRIGHGVSIAWEDDATGLMRKMKREGIAVEICLTSNASILGVKGEDHPLRLYRANGVPVFLNTDDEGVSRTTLSLEWVKAVRDQRMGYRDLK